jgi:hypothetical protein
MYTPGSWRIDPVAPGTDGASYVPTEKLAAFARDLPENDFLRYRNLRKEAAGVA